jgi:hypothetical protein
MRIKQSTLAYLKGDKFSNGLEVEFDWDVDDARYLSRIDWLVDLCTEKRVIHAGCVDHSTQQITQKLTRGKWLHERLVHCTQHCLGVDKSAAGIEYLRTELGYTDVECLDLLDSPRQSITNASWDYLILGEVLEHIDNPVAFLSGIRARYADCVEELMITVPNAFARDNFRGAKRNVEAINTDHRYWFTPYTLCKIVSAAGFTVDALRFCRNGVIKKRTALKNAWFKRHPLLRNNIILTARLR